MKAGGTDIRLVHNTSSAYEWGAVVSPDGHYVAFTSDVSGQDEIYLLQIASGEITRLTYEGGMYPSWVP